MGFHRISQNTRLFQDDMKTCAILNRMNRILNVIFHSIIKYLEKVPRMKSFH